MSTDQEMVELTALFPGETYTLKRGSGAGEEIVVKPVTFGKLKVFIDAVSSLFLKLDSSGIRNIEDPSTWPLIFSVAQDEVMKIMGYILNRDKKWFEEVLMPEDGLHLFGMIVRQNINADVKKKFQELALVIRSAMQTSPST